MDVIVFLVMLVLSIACFMMGFAFGKNKIYNEHFLLSYNANKIRNKIEDSSINYKMFIKWLESQEINDLCNESIVKICCGAELYQRYLKETELMNKREKNKSD